MRASIFSSVRIIVAWCWLGLAITGAASESLGAESDERVDFVRDIRPIFRAHCADCHGADTQEAGLRLDLRRRALQGGDSGKALTPGKSSESLLIELAATEDEERRMPLGEAPLTREQIDLLRRWIDQGAGWPDSAAGDETAASDHWSFQPIIQRPLPTVKRRGWPQNAIDYFILARLEQEGLAPTDEADRYTLVRRLYLDLLGLPPTPRQADVFVADDRPDAYERLVDRLLASPRYGERWARRWLDLARYADTNGYEKDRVRSMWPYRDWVIGALNRDMPFNRFTVEQIAGDMLTGAGLEQRIATGFHRNTMINEEGGIDVEEYRFHSIVDRVSTTGTAWLGLTIACAQCHSHKYDPITQHEYYRMFALLNNADELEIATPNAHVAEQQAEIERQIAAIEAEMRSRLPELKMSGAWAKWEAEVAEKPSNWIFATPVKSTSRNLATMTNLPDQSVLVSGDIPNQDVYDVELDAPPQLATAIRLEALPHDSLPAGGPGRAVFDSGAGAKGDFLLCEVSIRLAKAGRQNQADAIPLSLKDATHSFSLKNRSAALAIDGDLDTGWSVAPRTGEAHHIVIQLSEPISIEEGDRLIVTLDQHYIHQMTLGRFRLSVTADEQPVESSGLPADVEQIVATPPEERGEVELRRLEQYYLSAAPELAEQQKRIAELRKGMPEHPTTLVMQERQPQHARVTHMRQRGEFLKVGEPVTPATPAVLPPLPEGAAADRLALARWLVDEQNPLTARVVMNRHWQSFFGKGLVRTTEDFGAQGAPPTHPLLLDWLAAEYMRRGWSTKQMHRLIVTSAAYRQSSRVDPKLLKRDADNMLLARGARVRVEAEVVRDAALSAANLLSGKIGGPSVFPPQPDNVTALSYGKLDWKTSTGADRYRRGLYTFTKRTSPYATFSLFDAPSGETCVARRDRSNTPLQALTLLNDPVFVEASQSLARRAVKMSKSTEGRAAWMFRRCLTRPPVDEELRMLVDHYHAQKRRFLAGELDARAIASVSEAEAFDARQVADLAAWTTVARALLNLDETITKE